MSRYVAVGGIQVMRGGHTRLSAGAGPVRGGAWASPAGNVSPHVVTKAADSVQDMTMTWADGQACATGEHSRYRPEANSSDGMRRRTIPFMFRRSRFRSHVAYCMRSTACVQFARRGSTRRTLGSARKYVAACRRDTVSRRARHVPPRAAALRLHAIALTAALPGAACPRSARPAHAFVVPRNSTTRVTPRHLL